MKPENFTQQPIALRQVVMGIIFLCILFFSSCRKDINYPSQQNESSNKSEGSEKGHLKQAKTYSSEVVLKWIDLNRKILLTTPRVAPGIKQNREFAYTGVALYEAVVNGMPAYKSLSSQLNQMPQMPSTQPGLAYHWAACANAALASMNKFFFPTTSAANIASMDSLESALNAQYLAEAGADELQRSIQFGKEVASRIKVWSNTDGADHAFDPYPLPPGPGFWVPTPPAFQPAIGPYWGNNRTFVAQSINNTMPSPPLSYSVDPASPYYQMEKEVYDVSQNLTPEQTAIGMFWLDAGIGAGGHWLAILRQVLTDKNSKLDIAALSYAAGGIYINDATISSFRTKYTYIVQRPVTFIRDILGHSGWNPLFATPAHPDYSSAHTVQSKAIADIFTKIFGENCQFTDHQFDNIGMAPRTYGSFNAVADEVAVARVYAGIHTRMACEAGLEEGEKVAENINSSLTFLKD